MARNITVLRACACCSSASATSAARRPPRASCATSCARRAWRTEIEIDSAGTGGWHVGAPPDERATAAAQRRGIALEGAARQVARRATSTTTTCCSSTDRENHAELLRARARRRGAREGPVLARVRPGVRRRAATSRCPTRTTAASAASTTCSTSSRRRAAGLLAELRARRREPARQRSPGARSPARGASAAATSTTRTRVELDGGGRAFVKTRDGARARRVRRRGGRPGVAAPTAARASPRCSRRRDELLALEWLERGPARRRRRGGARPDARRPSHRAGADRVRRDRRTTAPHAPRPARAAERRRATDWPAFYAERRLRPLAARAGASTARASTRVCERIADLAGPAEPPARLHGDLWSGNVLACGGRPYLIDPAAYGGHREVDLAMLAALRRRRRARTLAAYEEVAPLADGHEERVGALPAVPAARPRGAVRRRLRRARPSAPRARYA